MQHQKPANGQRHVIPADLSSQQPNNSYSPPTAYENKRVPCSGCGRPILWTAEQQQTWYEEMKAFIYAKPNLRCETCRKRGKHDGHRQRQRDKARRRSGHDGT